MKRAGLLLIVTALATMASAQGSSGPVFRPHGFDMTAVDRTAKPGDDFFQYANGSYLARAQIPADRPIVSRRLEMTDRTDQQLKTLLEDATNGVAEQQIFAGVEIPATAPGWQRAPPSIEESSDASLPPFNG